MKKITHFQENFTLKTKEDLKQLVEYLGFLPLFENSIPGFSVEEHINPRLWFSEEKGPWEWKGPIIQELKCAYGKFFEKKATFISKKWFYDFANYRRDGYDFDARFNDGLSSYREKELYELLEKTGPILSKQLKKKGNYGKDGKKGFDTDIVKLQEKGYVIIQNFQYEMSKQGEVYGWGVAEYATPEQFFGKPFLNKVYQRTPEASYQRLEKQLQKILPNTTEEQRKKLLK